MKLTIAVFFDPSEGYFSQQIIQGITETADRLGVNTLSFAGNKIDSPINYNSQDNIIYQLCSDRKIDGIVLIGSLDSYITDDRRNEFLQHFLGIPKVTVSSRWESFPAVISDNHKGLKKVIDHLIYDHEYRKIAFLKGPDHNMDSRERYQVYKDCLEKANIPLNEKLIRDGEFWGDPAYRVFSEMYYEVQGDIDAVVCANDEMALAVLRFAEDNDLPIPETFALTGFDNVKESLIADPALTTVTQSTSQMAMKALEVLICKIEGENIPELTELPTVEVIRESCGCNKLKQEKKSHTHSDIIHEQEQEQESELKRILSMEYQMRNSSDLIDNLIFQMMESRNKKELGNAVTSMLSKLGVSFFSFLEYRHIWHFDSRQPGFLPQTSREIFSLINGEALVDPDREEFFETKEIHPHLHEVMETDSCHLLLLPVSHQIEHYGYILLDINPHLLKAFFNLKYQLGSAIKRIQLLKEISDLDNLKNEFIANITHDFKSPLTIILNTVDLALNSGKKNSEEVQANYQLIMTASEQLNRSMNKLLDLAKMDSKGVMLKISKINLAEFLSRLYHFYSSASQNTGVMLRRNFADHDNFEIYTDEEKLEEVVINVLSNAFKFVETGKGIISLNLIDKVESILIRIDDNGIGIPKDKVSSIFNRFEQVQQDRKYFNKGTGIGLAFSKQLLQYLKGTIRAESEGEGKGSSFFIELRKGKSHFTESENLTFDDSNRSQGRRELPPLELSNSNGADDVLVFIDDPNGNNEYEIEKAKILIIDDEIEILRILAEYIRRFGYRNLILVSKADKVLDSVYEYKPDIIICDYNMPEMNGAMIHDALKYKSHGSDIPFIFISAVTDKEIIFEEKRKGAYAFLQKPVDRSELQITLRQSLERHFQGRSMLKLATHDTLTNLCNRRELLQELERELQKRILHPLSVLFCDIDRFKKINDTYGHQTGDRVLSFFGNFLRSQFRTSDTAGRYGGEEFLVILPDTSMEGAVRTADKMKKALKIALEKTDLPDFTVSYGISSLIDNQEKLCIELGIQNIDMLYVPDVPKAGKEMDWDEINRKKEKLSGILIDLADQALYRAKTTQCLDCNYSSTDFTAFDSGKCPKCDSDNLDIGRNRIVPFLDS